MLAKNNALDMRLYDFIVRLFDEQKNIIEEYAHYNTLITP
jgi:hypothetical protein